MISKYFAKIVIIPTTLLISVSTLSIFPTTAYAQTPGCDSNAVGIVEIQTNVPKTLNSYSIWLNVSNTQSADIGVDVDGYDCKRIVSQSNSGVFSWIKIGSNISLVQGTHKLRVLSYSNSFKFDKGMLINDLCVPSGTGSNCNTYEQPTTTTTAMSSTTTTTTSTSTTSTRPNSTTTSTRPVTTTTTQPGSTTTTTRPPIAQLTPVTNITSQIQSCWWLWCSVKLNWSPSTGGNGNLTYKVTTDIREPQYTKQNQLIVNWLPKGNTYPVRFTAQDSSGNKSQEKTIYLPVP